MLKNLTITKAYFCFVALAALSSCSTEGTCVAGCPDVKIFLSRNMLDKVIGGTLKGNVVNYTQNSPQSVQLVTAKGATVKLDSPMVMAIGQDKVAECKNVTCTNSAAFEIKVNQDLASLFDDTALNLTYQDDDKNGPAGGPRVDRSPVLFAKLLSETASATLMGISPVIERIGFSNGKLLSLRAFKKSMVPKKSLVPYTTTGTEIKADSPLPSAVFSELTGDQTTADFGQSRVVWLDVVPGMGLSVTNCPTTATAIAECVNPGSMGYPNNLLPLDLKAFAIAPGGEVAVIAQAEGQLKFAPLSIQTVNPPMLAWSDVAAQPMVDGKVVRKDRVLLAMGDLDKDGSVDLIAVHQDAQNQNVTVYLGHIGEIPPKLTYDDKLSASWQQALGSKPIGAIGIGDLNGDERADVVISRGLQVGAWLSRAALAPILGWTATVPVADMTVSIKALAIGQVDGTGKNDLVVASSSPPDAMGTVALQYLHAFLAP